MSEIFDKFDIDSSELEALLKEREAGNEDFLLVDVREQFEYDMGHIKGVDMLKPTSEFQMWAPKFLEVQKGKKVIFTCRTGSRSAQVTQIFRQNGLDSAFNHYGGIVTYGGEIES